MWLLRLLLRVVGVVVVVKFGDRGEVTQRRGVVLSVVIEGPDGEVEQRDPQEAHA